MRGSQRRGGLKRRGWRRCALCDPEYSGRGYEGIIGRECEVTGIATSSVDIVEFRPVLYCAATARTTPRFRLEAVVDQGGDTIRIYRMSIGWPAKLVTIANFMLKLMSAGLYEQNCLPTWVPNVRAVIWT